jgi:two-component system response regulator RegA
MEVAMSRKSIATNVRRQLLIVDGDDSLCTVLDRYFTRLGFEVRVEHEAAAALELATAWQPGHVVVDLKVPDQAGLRLVQSIKATNRLSKVVVVTSYASIATAVEAVKRGATNYLQKPVHPDDVRAAFDPEYKASSVRPPRPMSVDRLIWEHINRVLMENGDNISATARALSMHRRTLQRMLRKHARKED